MGTLEVSVFLWAINPTKSFKWNVCYNVFPCAIVHAEKILSMSLYVPIDSYSFDCIPIWTYVCAKQKGHHTGHIPVTTTCRTWGV